MLYHKLFVTAALAVAVSGFPLFGARQYHDVSGISAHPTAVPVSASVSAYGKPKPTSHHGPKPHSASPTAAKITIAPYRPVSTAKVTFPHERPTATVTASPIHKKPTATAHPSFVTVPVSALPSYAPLPSLYY